MENLIINCVGEASQEYATKMPTNDGMSLWGFLDHSHRLINGVEELLGSNRGSLEIPFKRGNNFGSRDLANSEPPHLLELLPEIVPDA
jgi:hypothetical protein